LSIIEEDSEVSLGVGLDQTNMAIRVLTETEGDNFDRRHLKLLMVEVHVVQGLYDEDSRQTHLLCVGENVLNEFFVTHGFTSHEGRVCVEQVSEWHGVLLLRIGVREYPITIKVSGKYRNGEKGEREGNEGREIREPTTSGYLLTISP